MLRETILVEGLLGVVLGLDVRSFLQTSASLVLAHAHRVTAMTFAVVAAFVGSLVARRDDVSADVMFQAEGSLGPHMRQALMLTFL